MITYSTNWMGPASIDWFKSRGLTRVVTKTFGDETLTYDEITENWSGGRIDVYGTGDPYNQEIGLPIMRDNDYRQFSNWLSGLRTEKMLSLEELVSMYEKTNPKIEWWHDKKEKAMDNFDWEFFVEESKKYKACASVWIDKENDRIEILLDTSAATYSEWIPGEGADIGLLRCHKNNKVIGIHLPLYKTDFSIFHTDGIRVKINEGFLKDK